MMYFQYANPKLRYSGAFDMPKSAILAMTPKENLPATAFVPKAELSVKNIIKAADSKGITFPLILKPNIGERGKNVSRLDNEQQVATYLDCVQEDLLVQEYAGYETHPIEAGIFVNKDPQTDVLTISNLTFRKFPVVIGDGTSTIEELVEKDPRCVYKFHHYQQKFGTQLQQVLPQGKEFLLEYIGSHNRGTGFIDKNHEVTPQFTEAVKKIIDKLDHYYYGRLDVKAKSPEALLRGEFLILEINGINAEPISIYDENCSWRKAYTVVKQHMYTIYDYSKKNKALGRTCESCSFWDFAKDAFRHQREVTHTTKI